MAKSLRTRADLLEDVYDAGVTLVIRGVILLCVSLILLWLFKVFVLRPLMVLAVLGAVGGGAVIVSGALKVVQSRRIPLFTVNCPYCDHPNQFTAEPDSDYDCEGCNRRVYYENGKPAAVREVTCTVCKAVYKVSVKAPTYTCDSCNRTLGLTDPNKVQVIGDSSDAAMRNYDVLLTQVGRQATDVAMMLQSVLVCNLPEARRQMENLPLTVMRNVPERKADALRRRLQDLGASAIVRATEAQSGPARHT